MAGLWPARLSVHPVGKPLLAWDGQTPGYGERYQNNEMDRAET